jgi:hypothetical protein
MQDAQDILIGNLFLSWNGGEKLLDLILMVGHNKWNLTGGQDDI